MERSRMALPAISVAAFFASACVFALAQSETQEPVATVRAKDLGYAVAVIGEMDEPIGKLLTIRGEMVEADYGSRMKVPPDPAAHFRVRQVGDRTLKEPVVITFARKWHRSETPAPGTKFEFLGYETGYFDGKPPEVYAYESKQRGRYATTGYRFAVEFEVLGHDELPAGE